MTIMGWPAFSNRAQNPYTSLLYEAMQRKGAKVLEFSGLRNGLEKSDIFHLHWPDVSLKDRSWRKAAYAGLRTLLYVLYARLNGARIVWTAHNLHSHDHFHPVLERLFWSAFIWELDGVISLSENGLESVRELRLGNRVIPSTSVAHGHYRGAYPNTVDRTKARQQLQLEDSAFVVGWIGQIRPYKGLPDLLTAWPECAAENKRLLIAGQSSDEDLERQLLHAASGDASICYHAGRVDDADLQYFINASDVIALPYRKILNSGSALLGLSFNRPVALPRSPVMVELQEQVGADWVYLYDGEFNATVLNDICRWTKETSRAAEAPLAALDFDVLAQKTLTFFQQVAAPKGGRVKSADQPPIHGRTA